ncbi:MAG: DUF4976 domain-containing protein [Candidatus Nitrosopelagicus sp.]|nr:MAG: DUF4976 domain-containing protein [Candidatus Nitrosopelagicus sp.]
MRPNVLFLVIDSFRADKCYGSKKTSVTPNLDYLIQNGIYFSQMISSAPASIPAVSSILTGLFPFKSLSLENDVYNLKKDIPNIIGILKNSGYETIATIPNILKLMNLNHIFNEINSYDDQSTLYDGIGEKILEKFDNLINNEPWVYYLHLNDIHGQAIFHKDFFHDDFNDVKLGKNQYERMVSLMDPWIGKILKRVNLSNTLIILTADHGSDVASFDSEMEKISKSAKEKLVIEKNFSIKTGQKITSKLPKFFNPLRRNLSKKYRAKRTSIVEKQISPVLDKIESEEQDPYKKRLLKNMLKASTLPFDEKFRIPLIFSGYGVDSHHITSQQIRSVDIFPTILDLLGIENNYQIHGKSLMNYFTGKPTIEQPAYIESHKNVNEGIFKNLVGIRTSKFKYFRSKDDPSQDLHLYDLESDPLEIKNIANDDKKTISSMESLIKKIQTSI